jgi:dTDP-4-amino-4,6-dideoxygalactose transaminase
MMMDQPAILGGKPVFSDKQPIVRPVLPDFESLAGEVQDILRTGMVTKGRHLQAFEEAVAEHLNVKHAVGVSSCTTGLMLTYRGLGLSGDVVVPSFTFMATVSALVWCGLRPVFADVDPGTTNLNPEAVEAVLTPQTSAIVAVHNFGNPADIVALESLAARRGIRLIFDAAHGFGALYQGQPVGAQGDAQVFSLSPTKLLIAGEGGIVATNDDALALAIRLGREYGNDGNYDSAFAGMNARMAEFNALVGLGSLALLEEAALRRNKTARLFQKELGKLPGIGFQEVCQGNRISYKDFSITVQPEAFGLTRDELAVALAAENIDTRKYYDPPVHRQKAYRSYYDGSPLPSTDWLSASSLSIPIWTHLSAETAAGICTAFERIHAQAREVHRFLTS